MLNDFWKQFKSGTDIRGVAVDGAGYEVNLTDGTVSAMVNGFILWLADKKAVTTNELKISVGRDSRISGPHILEVAVRSMLRAGVTVIDCDLSSTPAMFMTTVDMSCDGALQITASHHPYYRNGLKFFTREGGLDSDDITAILEYAQNGDKPAEANGGKRIDSDYMNRYALSLREMIKKEVNSEDDYNHPLKGFKIVVDAGNGVGGFYATDVLELLGADIRGSQFLEPDGMFPNHVPNPENEEAMASISKAVLDSGADLGVIFDTDVDRGGAVDSDGKEINRNRLVALASVIALEGNKGGTIVTDSITSSGLKDFIENNLGGKHLRFRRGYKNVINEAVRQNENGVNCPLAIETSGHAAMRENYFLDDGAYLVTKIIIKMAQLRKEGKKLGSVISNLAEPVESKEIRIKITEKDFRTYGEGVIADLLEYSKKQKGFIVANDNHEGVRVSFNKTNGNGWFLLRLSVHDPIMPLNIESDSKGGVERIYGKIKPFLETCEGLETYVKKAAVKKTKVKEEENSPAEKEIPKAADKEKTEVAVKEEKSSDKKTASKADKEKNEVAVKEEKSSVKKTASKADREKTEAVAKEEKDSVKGAAAKKEAKVESEAAKKEVEATSTAKKTDKKAELKTEEPKAEEKEEKNPASKKTAAKKTAAKRTTKEPNDKI